eukprot:scaffold6579_cov55-Cyclotella_meneghiniana.AAC.7
MAGACTRNFTDQTVSIVRKKSSSDFQLAQDMAENRANSKEVEKSSCLAETFSRHKIWQRIGRDYGHDLESSISTLEFWTPHQCIHAMNKQKN